MNGWLLLAFGSGLTPAAIMLVLYGFRTRFWTTEAGLGVFLLMLIIVVTYTIAFFSLMFPKFAQSDIGEFVRTVPRFAIAVVLWYLLFAFLRAQRRGRVEARLEAADREARSRRDPTAH